VTIYVRDSESDVWHWHPMCSHYPSGKKNVKIRKSKPLKGIFCPECIRLSKFPYICSFQIKNKTEKIRRLEV